MHAARLIALRHLLVDDAAAGRHPLDIPGRDGAMVAHAVPVLHGSGEYVSDGLDSAVWMPREARQIILRNVIAEVVKKQERIEVRGVAETERPAQVHARSLQGRRRFNKTLNRSNGHIESLPSFGSVVTMITGSHHAYHFSGHFQRQPDGATGHYSGFSGL